MPLDQRTAEEADFYSIPNLRPALAGRFAFLEGCKAVLIGGHDLGAAVYVVAEIGINHNGNHFLIRSMVEAAKAAGCNAVKFQCRTPEIIVPDHLKEVERDTPFGRMTHFAYRHKLEPDWAFVDQTCRDHDIGWFASCWDIPSVERLSGYPMVAHKVASACATDLELIKAMRATGLPVVISTGMCDDEMVDRAWVYADVLCHTVSTYPCPIGDLNLGYIRRIEGVVPGYSGHEAPEVGSGPSLAAVAMGARYIERHFTTNRSLAGSDQKASLELGEMAALVSDIRRLEVMLGDGVKGIRDCERPSLEKLRRVA